MNYEVRYLLNGEEHTQSVVAESAAEAAQIVQTDHASGDQSFELIQVHLIEEAQAEEVPA